MKTYACGLDPRSKYNAIMSSAANRNKEFSLGIDNFEVLFERNNGKCIYSGTKFFNEINHDDAASIDRIAHNEGYIPGNIVLCTRYFNNLKEMYFESSIDKVTYVDSRHVDDSFLIYKKLLQPENLIKLSLCDSDEMPDIKTDRAINRYLDRIAISITLGIKVPQELHKTLRARPAQVRTPDVKEFGNVRVVSTIGNSAKFSALKKYGDITRFPKSTQAVQSEEKEVPKIAPVLPVQGAILSDYEISKMYILYCDVNKPELSFADFKAKVTQPVCDFSLEQITERELFVIDSSKPITADNLLVVNQKYIKVLQAMKECSIDFEQFNKYLTNVCKVIYKD